MAESPVTMPLNTESAFADHRQDFFNSIDPYRTTADGRSAQKSLLGNRLSAHSQDMQCPWSRLSLPE
jgi:hypothetical protein